MAYCSKSLQKSLKTLKIRFLRKKNKGQLTLIVVRSRSLV